MDPHKHHRGCHWHALALCWFAWSGTASGSAAVAQAKTAISTKDFAGAAVLLTKSAANDPQARYLLGALHATGVAGTIDSAAAESRSWCCR